jgi:hypothetical protein
MLKQALTFNSIRTLFVESRSELIKPTKSNALRLYRKLRRFGLNWNRLDVIKPIGGGRKSIDTPNDSELQQQRRYILEEARRSMDANRFETNDDKIKQLIEYGYRRMDLAEHYGIPYERPVYFEAGHVQRKRHSKHPK